MQARHPSVKLLRWETEMTDKKTEALKLALEALERLKRAFFKSAPDGIEDQQYILGFFGFLSPDCHVFAQPDDLAVPVLHREIAHRSSQLEHPGFLSRLQGPAAASRDESQANKNWPEPASKKVHVVHGTIPPEKTPRIKSRDRCFL